MIKMPWQVERTRQVFPDNGWKQSTSGLFIPPSAMPPKRPTAADFFCGAGGMGLGLIQGGFEIVAAFDNDPWATITYTVNLGTYPMKFHFATPEDEDRLEKVMEQAFSPKAKKNKKGDVISVPMTSGSGFIRGNPGLPGVRNFFFGDVRKWTGERILDILGMKRGELGLVAGGPPCQGFSTAGKRDIMDPRNSLIFEFARLIIELWPTSIVMEEVPDILSMVTPEGVPVIDAFVAILVEGNYSTHEALKKSMGLMEKKTRAGVRKMTNPNNKGGKKSKETMTEMVKPEREQLSLF